MRTPRVIGLTSPGNTGFVRSLGCYDEVVSYDAVSSIPADRIAVFVDMAGSAKLRGDLHRRLGDRLLEAIQSIGAGQSHSQDATCVNLIPIQREA